MFGPTIRRLLVFFLPLGGGAELQDGVPEGTGLRTGLTLVQPRLLFCSGHLDKSCNLPGDKWRPSSLRLSHSPYSQSPTGHSVARSLTPLVSPPPFPLAPSDLSATVSQHTECALASGPLHLVSSSWNLPRFHNAAPSLPSGLCPNSTKRHSFLSYSKG